MSTERTLTLLRKPTEAAHPTGRSRPWPRAASSAFYSCLFPLAFHKIPQHDDMIDLRIPRSVDQRDV
ncbi:MAG TPA: hypothetical protein PK051_02735, partial [Trichococcus flocculiformis]|nr:hypothetical protein [Trichococcus flocculiformis]